RCDRGHHQRDQAEGAEQQQFGAHAAAGRRRLGGAGAEDQRRQIERQDQQRGQHAGAPGAQGQGGGDRTDQAQRRSADQEAEDQDRNRRRVGIDDQRQERRDHRQRQAGGQPVRGAFGEHGEFERQRRQGQQVEPAIGVIGGEQP